MSRLVSSSCVVSPLSAVGVSESPPPLDSEAELESIAEGHATETATETENEGITSIDDTDYITETLARLDHKHRESFKPGRLIDSTPAQHAHPRIAVHVSPSIHGLDPKVTSRAAIEAKLESLDQARKFEKRRIESQSLNRPSLPHPPMEQADEILKLLALRKLQLLQQHLKTDNQPILVRPATETHGNLYLGSVGASHHLPNLLANGITHILSVGRNLAQPFPTHFQYLYIPMLDSSTTKITPDVYHTSWKFVESARTGGVVPEDSEVESDITNASDATYKQSNQEAKTESDSTDMKKTPATHTRLAAQRDTSESDATGVSQLQTRDSKPHPATIQSVAQRSSAASAAAHLSNAMKQTDLAEGAIHAHARPTANHHVPPIMSSRASPSRSGSPLTSSPPRQLGHVLVHCFAGKSRSTTILLSYLMYSERWTLEQAYAHVKRCRPTINVRGNNSNGGRKGGKKSDTKT